MSFAQFVQEEVERASWDMARNNLRDNKVLLEGFSALSWKPTEAEVKAEHERLFGVKRSK